VGVEAGLATVEDAERLLASGLAPRCDRILVEPDDDDPQAAVETAAAVAAVLREGEVARSQLHHGYGAATWAVLEAALRDGHDIRIGLEDTTVLPDGRPAGGNAELVQAAVGLITRIG
jgi:uncharacterized protein (DUF849 family)